MVAPNLEHFFYVKLTFKLRTPPYTETTRYFSTTHYEAAEAWATQTDRLVGTLRGISGIGIFARGPLPSTNQGQVTIVNTRGTTGRYLRFTDYLEKEEVIEQAIEVHSFSKPIDSAGVFATGNTKIFVGLVKSVNVSNNSNTISLDIRSKTVERDILQKRILPDDFDEAPSRSRNKYLPLVFGQAEVTALPLLSTNSGRSWVFGLASTIGTTHTPDTASGGSWEFKLKNHLNDYTTVITAATTTTTVIDEDSGAGSGAPTSANIQTWLGDSYAVQLDTSSTTNYAIWGGYMYFYDGVAGAIDGFLNFSILSSDGGAQPLSTIARAKVDKANYTWNNNLSQDQISFTFDKPVPLDPNQTYFLAWNENNTSGGGTEHSPVQYSASTTQTFWVEQDNGAWGLANTAIEGNPADIRFALYGLTFEEYTSGHASNYAGVEVDQGAAGLGQTLIDLSTINLIVNMSGLRDDSSGTLTGTVNKTLNTALDAARLIISQGYDNIDDTTFSPETVLEDDYPRNIDGVTRGREYSDKILSDILTESSCQLVPDSSGNVRFWAYGSKQSEQSLIREDDCQLVDWLVQDATSVINEVEFLYDKLATPLPLEYIADTDFDFNPRGLIDAMGDLYDHNPSGISSGIPAPNNSLTSPLVPPKVQFPEEIPPPIIISVGGAAPPNPGNNTPSVLAATGGGNQVYGGVPPQINIAPHFFKVPPPRRYNKSISWMNGGSATRQDEIDSWTADSFTLYQTKRLRDDVTKLDWIREQEAAEFLAEYYLTVFRHPGWIFRIAVPFFERDYNSLELLEIVNIEHSDNPSETGSSWPEGRFPVDAGVENTRVTNGLVWRMAKKYRSRIIGKAVGFNIASPKEAKLIFTLKIINNQYEVS